MPLEYSLKELKGIVLAFLPESTDILQEARRGAAVLSVLKTSRSILEAEAPHKGSLPRTYSQEQSKEILLRACQIVEQKQERDRSTLPGLGIGPELFREAYDILATVPQSR